MTQRDDRPRVYRVSIPTQDNVAIYGEAVWREVQRVAKVVDGLDETADRDMTVRVPARCAALLEWIAAQEADGKPPRALLELIEAVLFEYGEATLSSLETGTHPILRVMAERAGTWNPNLMERSDEIPF